MELRPLGVRVLLLALGMVRSNIGAAVAAAHDFAPAPAFYDAFRKNIDARLGQGEDVMSADEYARCVADAALAQAPPRYLSFGGQARGAWLLGFLPRTMRLDLLWKTYSGKTPKA
jgi:1-acylglycerone phosphate reductase